MAILISNQKVKVASAMTRYTKYGAHSEIPSVMSFGVQCKSKLEVERKEIFEAALLEFEAALRNSGVSAMAIPKGKVQTEFEKLRRDCSKYIKGESTIEIVMELIVADTDDADAFQGSISVKINDKEKINIPLKVLLIVIPDGMGWSPDMSSIKRMQDVETEFKKLVQRNNAFA